MSKRVLILKGLQGSGKSTWAREQVEKYPGQYKIISTDSLRDMLDAGKFSKSNEKFMLKVRDSLILLGLQEGYSIIVDAIHLHPKHEPHIRELVRGQAIVYIKDFTDVPLETCIERDLQRTRSVGEKVIRQWHRGFIQPKPVPPTYIEGLPDVVICDLDGTLALLNGRSPYDASTCEDDLVNEPVRSILANCGAHIILVSGRSEEHRPQTERWLQKRAISYAQLYMRPKDDSRKDAIIKQEIYENHIVGKCNIKYVLDDRSQVVNFWRSKGLIVLQVADGDF